ncbi:Gingipain R1 precursor [Limihaloglobus sulfuriphilus]|uniref:Gingipain R1 n=1 Tax=Limihaloglobus sulfuriphilus TaxID=1851148 RepID=A0A1Q2MI57_9BACT|nr:C25 family cysteine peptidase [Limihaloglobus sulfuriphilus]AQQ72339.1 Gingipain R1 precursor [Limihaloglobus sulfuriphilus]
MEDIKGLHSNVLTRLVIGISVLSLTLFFLSVPTYAAQKEQMFTETSAQADVKVLQADAKKIIVDVKIDRLQKQTKEAANKSFEAFSLAGRLTTSQVGKPQLPVIRELIAVPDNAKFEVSILESSSVIIEDIDVYPFQPPLKDGQKQGEFVIDKDFALQDDFYPYDIVSIDDPAIWRDITVVGVTLNPACYNPVTRQLKVYKHLKVKIEILGGDKNKKRISQKNAKMYKGAVKNFDSLDVVEEDETIDFRYDSELQQLLETTDEPGAQLKALPEEDQLKSGTPYDSSRKILSIRHSSCSTYATLYPLLDWHRRKGLPYYSYPISGTYTAQQIKNIIVSQYNAHPELEYVLLVGDIDYIPWQQNWGGSSWPNDLPGDHWYACITGGSSPDMYADVAIGRLPCKNDTELQNMVDKILSYEKTPPAGSWPNTAILMSHKENAPGKYQGCSEDIRTATYSYDPFSFVTAYGASAANDGDDATNNDVIGALNSGAGILNYRGHGGWSDISGPPYGEFWGSSWNTSYQAFSKTTVSSVNNGGMLPVVFSISCTNAWLDAANSTLGEHFIKQTDSAVAFLGASRPSYTTPNHDFDKSLFKAIGSYGVYNVGKVLNSANAALVAGYGSSSYAMDNVKMYLWLGDPAMEIRTSGRVLLNVSHPSSVYNGVMTVNVRNSYGTAVQNALVCIDGQGVYTKKYTNSSGNATFYFIPDSTGAMDVTVTKHNYTPYEGSVDIVPIPNAITNIEFDPASPSSLAHGERVYANFNYTTNDTGGIQIFVRPYTNGSRTPNYGAHGSGWYAYPSGSGSGWFTINSGNVVVDQVQFTIYNHDQSQLLLELYVDVDFTYGHSVHNVSFENPSPVVMKWGENYNIDFDYYSATNNALVFFTPYTNGSVTPGRISSPSPFYPEGRGSGDYYFRFDSGQKHIDQIRAYMVNSTQTVVLFEEYIDVDITYEGWPQITASPSSFYIEMDSGGTTWSDTLRVNNVGDGTLHYGLRDRIDSGVILAMLNYTADLTSYVNPDTSLGSDGEQVSPEQDIIILPPPIIIIPNPWIFIIKDLVGVTVAYDLSHGETNASAMDAIKNNLILRGAKINYINTGPITENLLEPYDVLWVNENSGSTWTTAERAAVANWVDRGRGLLVYGDQPGTSSVLTTPYGMNFTATNGTSGYSSNITSHAVTDGCDEVYLPAPLSSLLVSGSATSLVRDAGGLHSVAVADSGLGRAAAMADDYFWGAHLEYGDNFRMARQAFKWLTPPGAPWLNQNPKSGSVPISPGYEDVDLDIDATGYEDGDYYSEITITSDDPDQMPMVVPVHLKVEPVVEITNVVSMPTSPTSLPFGNNVNITFDYSTNVSGGIKIFPRPYTNGSLTPNYSASSSPEYPVGTGSGDGYFTITSGDVVVDQIGFIVRRASNNELIDIIYVDVEYEFADLARLELYFKLEGSQRPDPSGWEFPVYVKLFKPGADVLNATPVYMFSATTQKDGSYAECSAWWAEVGTYDVTIEHRYYSLINVRRNVTVNSPITTIYMGTMFFGNAARDDILNMYDLALMSKSWGLYFKDPSFVAGCDADMNGWVNIYDLRLLAGHWLRTSPVTVIVKPTL